MRDLIASNAPLREGRHTARQNPPKHYPWGFKGPQPLGTPFSPIFRRATKDGAPGGPTEKRMPVKTRNKTITPPEGVGIAEWLVKTYYPKQTQNGQTPPVCPFAFILRQHRTIASATFSGAFTLEIRYFFLKYTKYSCEKLPFSDDKSLAESSLSIYAVLP